MSRLVSKLILVILLLIGAGCANVGYDLAVDAKVSKPVHP